MVPIPKTMAMGNVRFSRTYSALRNHSNPAHDDGNLESKVKRFARKNLKNIYF